MPWTTAHELRHARQEAGLEQKDLAAKLDPPVVEKTISRWENSHGEPSITQWRQIARICRAPWLLTGPGGDVVTYVDGLVIVDEGQLLLPIELPPSKSNPALTLV